MCRGIAQEISDQVCSERKEQSGIVATKRAGRGGCLEEEMPMGGSTQEFASGIPQNPTRGFFQEGSGKGANQERLR